MNPNQTPRDIDDSAFAAKQPSTPPPNPRAASASPFSTMPDVRPPAAPATPQSLAPAQPVVQHVPNDISARLTETPQINSMDVPRKPSGIAKANRFKNVLSIASFIACIILAAFLINQFIFQSYFVDGTSMTPTLQNNDRLIISKVERTVAQLFGKPYIPARGQIVVLDSSLIGTNGVDEQLIKRVIGLPGDIIHIEAGVVTIKNDQNPTGFDPAKTLDLHLAPTYSDGPLDFTVGPTQVFVMGDNRVQNGSYDSRAFGPTDVSNLEGRLWARVLPINDAKLFSTAYWWLAW